MMGQSTGRIYSVGGILFIIVVLLLVYMGIQLGPAFFESRYSYVHASELPADFVVQSQEAGDLHDIPWYYIAAYFQVREEADDGAGYPGRADIFAFAEGIQFEDRSQLEVELRRRKGDEIAEKTLDRAEHLRNSSEMFSSDYVFPIPTSEANYSDTWRASRAGGEREHLGIDIFAPEGTPIYANTAGRIERKAWNDLGGNTVGLRGKNGLYYYYAHLESYPEDLERGKRIEKGTVIGYVGNTGNAEGTPHHLHFGMRTRQGEWINPYNFLEYWERIEEREL